MQHRKNLFICSSDSGTSCQIDGISRCPIDARGTCGTEASRSCSRRRGAETMGRTATRTWRRGKAPVASGEPSRLGTQRATSDADFWRAEQGGRYFVYRAPARSPRSRPRGLVGGFVAIAASFSTISSGVLLRTNDLGCARRRAAPSTSACLAVSRLVVIADDGRGARACIKAV
jgi:hypothetical protein